MADSTDVLLKAGDLEAVVRPAFGGLVSSLRWRGCELLDVGKPREAAAIDREDYLSGGIGGLDDCFPSISACRHPTRGVSVPDHGELWYRPAEVIGSGPDRIVLEVAGEELPFLLRRTISVGWDRLQVEYLLEHSGEEELPVLWSAHPLFAASPGMRLELPAAFERIEWPVAPGVELGEGGRLRTAEGAFELDDWEAVPEGACAKLFAPWAGPVSLVHPAWDIELTVSLEAEHPAHLGLWFNRGAFPAEKPVQHVAVEPMFGDSDSLELAAERGSCLRLAPGASATWSIAYALGPAAS